MTVRRPPARARSLGSRSPMPGQFALPGFEAPMPAPTDRLLFLLRPDAQAAARVAALVQRLFTGHGQRGLAGVPVPVPLLHVTLHELGVYAGVPNDVVARASAAATAVSMRQFNVSFDAATRFSPEQPRHPFVLTGGEGVIGCALLHEALGTALRDVGFRVGSASGYTPHLTLARGDNGASDFPVEPPIAWTVSEFLLVHSLIGQRRHVVLGRWRLAQ
ncbi:RNA 2',3'-cyclic 3'-phosphodiesterase [Paraburkholderia kururiensis]|uniref:2'-5' RNA ligase family protein n=1 Tax=Paraburkholderia kururiensis TaxID=984307 RepID=UPI0039A74D99